MHQEKLNKAGSHNQLLQEESGPYLQALLEIFIKLFKAKKKKKVKNAAVVY